MLSLVIGYYIIGYYIEFNCFPEMLIVITNESNNTLHMRTLIYDMGTLLSFLISIHSQWFPLHFAPNLSSTSSLPHHRDLISKQQSTVKLYTLFPPPLKPFF